MSTPNPSTANQPTLLAIDTSNAHLSLGVHHHGRSHCVYEAVGNRQSALILPTLHTLLAEAGLTLADIDTIVYAQGPGAFTGLRIGIGVAQGLAMPFDTPLMGIPCLDAVAALLPGQPCVLAATDARMGELFYAWYNTASGQRLSDYQVGAAADIRLPENSTSAQATGVGNAFGLEITLPVAGQNRMPTAADYLALALSGRYTAGSAAEAELLYVRNKIALTAAEQAARKAGA
ncbi:tRNA (adenosine(37)-N6)-threonylcarbamoyltransferase complex dimerization subunit type 1 TsaB [Paralysiella testudinis]|uniref:tRNA (Adenosine(37)-N6)-threonylcarbamoyltransferase complex dimerization subunit type 1 TsaB n=1 Tax=Paralysiella testudinis TaxID=2809020 RepID=A0A892ZHF6_9NEIS|nr:tRNA (adenosine(37)-N6)-threonylcarbamoyltransferase complex dimerization subunit type 1 TsaB [Paralysiella testudinis]QRQ82975.1 tRNA (adenosine(37)-N6)-threonylcarbamoyltransferase complex dimerization subunit type 1 TsaB [Paralysiella testudinis]